MIGQNLIRVRNSIVYHVSDRLHKSSNFQLDPYNVLDLLLDVHSLVEFQVQNINEVLNSQCCCKSQWFGTKLLCVIGAFLTDEFLVTEPFLWTFCQAWGIVKVFTAACEAIRCILWACLAIGRTCRAVNVSICEECAIRTDGKACVVPVEFVSSIAVSVTHCIRSQSRSRFTSTAVGHAATLSTGFWTVLTQLSVRRSKLSQRAFFGARVRWVVAKPREWTNSHTNALWIRVCDDAVVWLARNVTKPVEQVITWCAFKAALWISTHKTLNRALCAFISRNVVKIQLGACQYACVVHIEGSVWNGALSYTFSGQFVCVHSLFCAKSFALSCRIISIVTWWTGAYAGPCLIILKKLVDYWTIFDTTTSGWVCVCVWVAVLVALSSLVLGKISKWACLDAESSGIISEVWPPTV